MKEIGEVPAQFKTFDGAMRQIAIAGAIAGQRLEAHFFRAYAGRLKHYYHEGSHRALYGDGRDGVAEAERYDPVILQTVGTNHPHYRYDMGSCTQRYFQGLSSGIINLFSPTASRIGYRYPNLIGMPQDDLYAETKKMLGPVVTMAVRFIQLS